MRRASRVQVRVREITIGGEKPLTCLPLMAANRKELLEQAAILVDLAPDIVEWRADAYPAITGREVAKLLPDLRRSLGRRPLLFTCRIESEGGLQTMALERRLEVIQSALHTGDVDLVDFELTNGQRLIDGIREQARRAGCSLLLSFHDFQATPPTDQLLATLVAAQAAGADIAKVAVMPKKSSDVLSLLTACDLARQGVVDIPLIAISMGEAGMISRIAGPLFGSDITFAAGTEASAPGQLPIKELRRVMKTVLGQGIFKE